ncbi:MAG TPA: signal peptide peptidase SppA [Candidatus Paceibacterota bacterium]|nr:signal peptide peptidase SppA [Verrucomicrobiota bacterium]HSA11794.1 signal peptide peptidase SppA [Candidatus Paceibacterota bacterium]
MVFALVVLVLLVISVFFNIGHALSGLVPVKVAGYQSSGPRIEEVLKEDNNSSSKIALVTLDGIITSQAIDQGGYSMVDVTKAQLKRAAEDDRVKAVILKVDSPGGEVLASDEIARAIAEFQSKTRGKPVVCSMGSLAASGGYYISAPCRWIVAHELTITGSIGVILSTWNYRGLMDKVGLQPQTFKSGKYKDMLGGSRDPDSITQEEREMVQALVNETYRKFTNVVATGRARAHDKNQTKGRALSKEWAEYADGRVLSGTEAYKLGFVDELGTFEDAISRAKALAGITRANLVEYEQRYDLSDFFRLFGQTDSKVVKVDLGVEAPKLRAGQLYFLSPTFLQ